MSTVGISFNVLGAASEKAKLEAELQVLESAFKTNWEHCWPQGAGTDFNPNSPTQIETLLWGGEVKIPYDQEVLNEDGEAVRFKSGAKVGQVKTKKTTKVGIVNPMVTNLAQELFKRKGWDMKSSAQTLQNLVKYDKAIAGAFAADILELRNKAKTITTYYKPYINFANEGTIHPAYNHCVTQTGRLSSSKPNMQNITSKDK
jgi:DNA polymerase I-like protein with 3'-5' exonuclease and polymerase domains